MLLQQESALRINDKHNVFALSCHFFNKLARSAVILSENPGVLEKIAFCDFVFKSFFIKKEIIFSFLFPRARSAGRAGDVPDNGRELMGQLIDKGCFSRACRSADYKDESLR